MDGIVPAGLGERQLMADAVKFITPVPEPVGPRDQMMSARAAAALVRLVAVEQRAAADLVGPQAGPDTDHGRRLPGELQPDLGTRRRPGRIRG